MVNPSSLHPFLHVPQSAHPEVQTADCSLLAQPRAPGTPLPLALGQALQPEAPGEPGHRSGFSCG